MRPCVPLRARRARLTGPISLIRQLSLRALKGFRARWRGRFDGERAPSGWSRGLRVDDFSLRIESTPRLGCMGRGAAAAGFQHTSAGDDGNRRSTASPDRGCGKLTGLGAGYAKPESITGSASGKAEPK